METITADTAVVNVDRSRTNTTSAVTFISHRPQELGFGIATFSNPYYSVREMLYISRPLKNLKARN